jgi:hypothetical protein
MPCKALSHSSYWKESCIHSIFIEVGFDSIDFGFCLAKAIPLQDTAAVLGQLDCRKQKANYCIIANTRGAQMASGMLKSNT